MGDSGGIKGVVVAAVEEKRESECVVGFTKQRKSKHNGIFTKLDIR